MEENTKKDEVLENNNVKLDENKNQKTEKPKKKSKLRRGLVLAFLTIVLIVMYVIIKGSYLEYKELGENYINVFWTNIKYRYIIMGVNFVLLYFIMYFTNRGIKKGLSVFFEQEKKEMPKLPNKSISLVISIIVSIIISSILTPKILLLASGTSFGITDKIFNLDISYYMFIKPIINIVILYFTVMLVF